MRVIESVLRLLKCLELKNTAAPDVAPSGAVRLCYNPSTNYLDASANGGAYGAVYGYGLGGVMATAAEINAAAAGQTGYPMQSAELTFTETSGAGVWTGSVALPAGATLEDIIINGVALWTSQTSATLTAGDAGDAAGYYTGVDLKATDLLAGESISFALAGGKAGAYIANSQVSPRYSATARTISVVITKVGTTGTAGRTRATVIWSAPAASTAATKV